MKDGMMALWKRIFNDSDDYIRLVFDTYFDAGYALCRRGNGGVVAGMLGVPYTFVNKLSDDSVRSVRGLYLCGLATDQEYRGRGIMASMLEEMSRKAAEDGFAFTFLIPAGESLFRYYHILGYRVSSFRYESMLTSQGGAVSEWATLCRLDNPDEAARFCFERELEEDGPHLLHSPKDFKTVFHENRISGGDNIIMRKYGNLINGVAILSKSANGENVVVKKIYVRECDRPEFLRLLAGQFGDGKLILTDYHSDEADLKERIPYGMMRILNADEILKFTCNPPTDSKYSILVKEEFGISLMLD